MADRPIAGVEERPDDPHRLAAGFLKSLSHDGPAHLLRYWRDDFHEWRDGAYRPVPDSDIRARVTEWTKGEFLRLNKVEIGVWSNQPIVDGKKKRPAKPTA